MRVEDSLSEVRKVSAGQSWRAHWTVVLAAAAGVALSTVPAYSIGLMIQPLEREFGWSRAEISFGATIGGFVALLLTPFVGLAIDRSGPRRIAIAGSVLISLGLAALSLTNANIWSWWLLWTVLASLGSLVGPTVWTATISSMFDRGRGFALAVALCGSGVAASVTPILGNHLVEHYGWRGGYIGLALFWGLLTIPLIALFLFSANDVARRDLLIQAQGTAAIAPPALLPGYTVREGLRAANFLKLAVAAFVTCLVSVSFITNLVPILTALGHDRDTSAALAGIVGICAIIGRLSSGYLVDHLSPKRVTAGVVALPMISAVLLLVFPMSVPMVGVAAGVLGLALGAELDAVAFLASRYLGMRSFGALFGTIAGIMSFGVGVGPVVVNYVYDTMRSYSPALWAYIPASILSALLFLSLNDASKPGSDIV